MKVAISQSNYIPWKGYFEMIDRVDHFVLYDEVQFTRRDWRNRNKIKTPQGLHWLTIPVEVRGKYEQKISETRIADASWAQDHWEMIRRNYKKASCFEELEPVLSEWYQEASGFSFLSEVNEYFLRHICNFLGISTRMQQSSDFDLAEDRTERLLSICRDLGASCYLSGPAAKSYLDEEVFRREGIEVEWMAYGNYPEYAQANGDFEHGVSILDLLLCNGPLSVNFFRSTI